MPSSLTSVKGWIKSIPNEENRRTIHKFVGFMESTDTSENYKRGNLIVVIFFAKSLTLGVTMHINSTHRAYDECLRQQSTQQAGPLQIEMLYANDLNNVVQKLSMGGMCVFDGNLKALEEELGSEFSQPVKESLKRATEQSLVQTAAAMGGVPAPVTEQECAVKQTWLRSLDS